MQPARHPSSCSNTIAVPECQPMNSASSRHYFRAASALSCLLLAFIVALATGFVVGCGGSVNSSGSGTTSSGNTAVTVLASSTANDQLSEFNISVQSLTLTSQSGKTVTLFSTPQSAEFIHLNGNVEPLATVSVPQDVYTSASAVVENAGFECITVNSSGALVTAGFNYEKTPLSVTVNMSSPITIAGAAIYLSLDLLVSESATWTTCDSSATPVLQPYSLTPTFNLQPLTILSEPTNSENGKSAGLRGLVTAVDGSSFTVQAPDGPTWTVTSNGSTVYQGISGLSMLGVGMPVNMDLTFQEDGSQLATRVAVPDTDTTDLSVSTGPVEYVSVAWPAMFANEADEVQGYLPTVFGSAPFSFGDAVFQTSGQFTNLQSLPFSASFSATNMVAGQIVSITTQATSLLPAPTYVSATTMTLVPQTINGTVSAISSDSGFTTYTVTLAPYDLLPALAVQGGQTTLLTNPNTVVVYADENTQMLNTNPIGVGSVVRFYGLVFNDNGTLRMDCAQVNDGVAE